jgi:hypothetical protein
MKPRNNLIEAAAAFLELPTSSSPILNENNGIASSYNKVNKELKAGHTNAEGYEHEHVTMPAGHHLIHHAEYGEEQRDQGEHRYSGKHPEGHSHTMIDTDTPTKSSMLKEIRKQNPHLSADTHKALATAIHKDFHGN